MCGSKIIGGVTGQNQNWRLENRFFRFKTGFSGQKPFFSDKFLRKFLKTSKRPTLCGKFRKIPVSRKIPPSQLFFGPLEGCETPPPRPSMGKTVKGKWF